MNRKLITLPILALSIAVSGCGGMSPIRTLEANTPPVQANGFKVLPPQRSGWNFNDAESQVAFYRLLGGLTRQNEPQTFVITVETKRAPDNDIATADSLARYTGRFSSTVSPERRQRLLEHRSSAYRDQGTDCVRFAAVVEEQPRQSIMQIRGAGFVCRHPFSPGHVIQAMYSERHVDGVSIQSPEQEILEAEAVLKSVEFTPLK